MTSSSYPGRQQVIMRSVSQSRTLLACSRALSASAAPVASRFYSADAAEKNLLGTSVSDDEGKVLKDEFWQNKKVVLFGVPGAFTPVCSSKHVCICPHARHS